MPQIWHIDVLTPRSAEQSLRQGGKEAGREYNDQRILVENHPATPNILALNAGARTVFIKV